MQRIMTRPVQHLLGAHYLGDGCTSFLLWAPKVQRVEVNLVAPTERLVPLEPVGYGYFHAQAENVAPGARYFYRLDGGERFPDPASRFQPEDVHGPSEVIDPAFAWEDQHWHGLPLKDYIIYELHVGTFTEEGTFDAVHGRLDDLCRLGVTAIELMPVAQFPGTRNWGYDGAFPFAAQNSYGGPDGLRRLVNACHKHGLAVVLDVVYNHLGPDGNYLPQFGHYFLDRYKTPWGAAVNFDGPHSDEVRRYFIENALHWVRDFHFDALRLDAVHAIVDESARPLLQQLGAAVHREADRLNRRVYAIAESNRNDVRHTQPVALGGYGLDVQWNDDFHHALHVLLTGESDGYYEDFNGLPHLVKAMREGFAYSGEYSPFRQRCHGVSSRDLPARSLLVFSQNHDQVGNRACGERLSALVSFEELKLAAAAVLLSPYMPLLFMGEEYAETAPFPYFVSHLNPELIEAVRRGRREEFAAFAWQGEVPDPQAEETRASAVLRHGVRDTQPRHGQMWEFYRELIRLRKSVPALAEPSNEPLEVDGDIRHQTLWMRRWVDNSDSFVIFSFAREPQTAVVPLPSGTWTAALDSADPRWAGGGSELPSQVVSDGSVALRMAASSMTLLLRQEEK